MEGLDRRAHVGARSLGGEQLDEQTEARFEFCCDQGFTNAFQRIFFAAAKAWSRPANGAAQPDRTPLVPQFLIPKQQFKRPRSLAN